MPTCPFCGVARRTNGPRGAIWVAQESPSLTPSYFFETIHRDLAPQRHNLASRINSLRASLRALEGAMAAPDTMLAICQRHQMRFFVRVVGFLQSTINCRQTSRTHEFIINSHCWTGAHTNATFDTVLKANEVSQV